MMKRTRLEVAARAILDDCTRKDDPRGPQCDGCLYSVEKCRAEDSADHCWLSPLRAAMETEVPK